MAWAVRTCGGDVSQLPGRPYTHAAYLAAWQSEPPTRYWLDKKEVDRRLEILAAKYDSIGMGRSGREHSISFAAA